MRDSLRRLLRVIELSRYGDISENAFYHFGNLQTFDLVFGTQNDAVFKNRQGHRFDVVGRDEVSSFEHGQGAAGQEQRLRGAWSSPHEHGFVLARRADKID